MTRIDRRKKAVLILECDSETLVRQSLDLGDELQTSLKIASPDNPIDCIKSYTGARLLESFLALYETKKIYRNVIIIGHSNQNGLVLSADGLIDWRGVANWIKPFEPHRVILLACEAGQWLPCSALFETIPKLKEILALQQKSSKTKSILF